MFRWEQKYEINSYQYKELYPVIRQLVQLDAHAGVSGEYSIRSLYFDDMYHTAYTKKMDGVYQRKKYRIRIYEYSDTLIHLEKKQKAGAYILKEYCPLTKEEYYLLLAGDCDFLLEKESQMAKEFYLDIKTRLLRPKVIVDYEREAYVFDAGEVRITFDKHIRGCFPEEDIFEKYIPSYEVYQQDTLILEIKFTNYLPERIRNIFQVRNLVQTSASKFCMCTDRIREIV